MPEIGLPPSERSMRGALGAHVSWVNTRNRTERTAPAREAFDGRFEHEVDPDGVLPLAERAKKVENARRAYFLRLALKSAKARRLAKEAASRLNDDSVSP